MCNGKGWSVAYFTDHVSVEPHSCRVYGDCRSVDNTLEEAADEVAAAYEREYEWALSSELMDLNDPDTQVHLINLRNQADMWSARTHPDYIFYKEQQE